MEETNSVASALPSPRHKIVKRAIVYALLFDTGSSFAFGFLAGLIYIAVISGGSFIYFSDLQRELAANNGFTILTYFFGSVISVMAGYLAAEIGKHRPYAHALWAALILGLIHLALNFTRITFILTKTTEVGFLEIFNLFSLPFIVLTYLIGAHLYKLVNTPR